MDQAASVRIIPHYITGNGFDPVLVLTNPSASQITVTVTAVGDSGAAVTGSRSFTIPANGSISADTLTITRAPFARSINGWLRIESPNVPLDGVLILDGNQAMTSGKVTAHDLVQAYLDRINAFDKQGPKLNCIITLNASAL